MNLLKKLLIALALLPALAMAEEGFQLDRAPDQTKDLASLQRGSKLFVNYCLGCHAASSMRYNRLRDIGLDEDTIKANLLFTGDKVGDLMTIAMPPKDAKQWFGATPPDLSVIARSRATEDASGADWLYTYLRTFYKDDTRPTGWNNMVFPNVGMPHVLWELQGVQKPVYVKAQGEGKEAKEEEKFDHFEMVQPGKMSKAEYDRAVADLVAYLQWMSEPTAELRHQLGVWVVLFLGLLVVLCWRLNASYWKEVK
ncbi:MAG TPA: cytochrome c1 [Burkholderiaceae bacterium]